MTIKKLLFDQKMTSVINYMTKLHPSGSELYNVQQCKILTNISVTVVCIHPISFSIISN